MQSYWVVVALLFTFAYCDYTSCYLKTAAGTINLNGASNSKAYAVMDDQNPWMYYLNFCGEAKGFDGKIRVFN